MLHGVVLLGPGGGGDHVDHLVVPVVPDVHLVHVTPVEHLVPVLLGHEAGGVHGAPVTDHQAVPLASLCQSKEGVLNLNHCPQKIFLENKIQPRHDTWYLRAKITY